MQSCLHYCNISRLQQSVAVYKEFGHLLLNIDYGVYITEIKWYSNSALIYCVEFLYGSQKLCS